ncbi:serine protease [Massilia sp. WF1]|uniref:NfeD family protein n=1 Tax=unclassified Massilia TaxID=2609279 RepID=UPI0006497416|nr:MULTISPECIES: nodulation protein NfeD [unclassified Massilia]ALK96834.1 serine protease [Massilia sp. WG5]KLU38177.1 serine protease [Massilia sp. WF1]
MVRRMHILACAALCLLALVLRPAAHGAAAVGLLTIDGVIGPANADYVVHGLARSARLEHQLVILKMDTPGGLDTAMREIIKAILSSPVPVVAYVAPSGARAASAGTYILYASHIAAMAPGTNLGAATPVAIGIGQAPPAQSDPKKKPDDESTLAHKQVNDAAAYLRGLAQMRGRNAAWAERAVREAVSLTAEEALTQKVIELVAPDVPALLAQLDGRTLTVLGQARRLETKGVLPVEFAPGWRTRLLETITHPSVALLMMTIGIYGLVFEFMNPGFVAPGVVGAICLLLALYALQLLPVNYAGLALVLLGLMLMVAEAFLPSFGVVGFGGVVAFVAGALMLVDTEVPGFGIPVGLIGALGLASALLLAGTARLALSSRRRPLASGDATLIGATARVETVAPDGGFDAWIRIEGELWQAACALPLSRAQTVRVVARKGLTLEVVPVDTS